MFQFPKINTLYRATLTITGLWIIACGIVHAQNYETVMSGVLRTVQIEPMEIDGRSYVSVNSLCAQLGGSCESIASQMRVNLAGQSAILAYGESEVHSSLNSTILSQAIIQQDGETYVAKSDLLPLLQKAFGISMQEKNELAPLTPEMEPLPEETAVEESETPEETEPTEALPTPINIPETLSAAVVVIDAGHGGRDTGYTAQNGLSEKELTLKLSEKVLALLKEKTSSKLYATRREDVDLSNAERVKIANESAGTLFVSLHAGVSRSVQAYGVDLYIPESHSAGQSRALGATPQRDATRALEQARLLAQALGEALAGQGGANVRGVRQAPLRVLNQVGMPGVLIEVGHLSNPAEAELLMQESHLDKLALAIVEGIERAANPTQEFAP